MNEFILKTENYNKWSEAAIKKIQDTIKSCQNQEHLTMVKKMIDNFIIVTSISVDDSLSEDVHNLSKSLWLSYKLKENKILTSKQK